MKLQVLESSEPWYAAGLNFSCTQCGNCCSGPPGFVSITTEEIITLARFLNLTPEETVERHCRKLGGEFALREQRNIAGQYDCVFLEYLPGGKRICGVYSARPLQCRTWPFWRGNLISKEAWDAAAVKCHGMNTGKHFSREEIDALEAAREWPEQPPGA